MILIITHRRAFARCDVLHERIQISTGRPAENPPSTTSACPVIHEDSSDARNRTAFAISSGSPNRPSGMQRP